jgi:hypothetical protein
MLDPKTCMNIGEPEADSLPLELSKLAMSSLICAIWRPSLQKNYSHDYAMAAPDNIVRVEHLWTGKDVCL